MKHLLSLFLTFFVFVASAQFNMTLKARVDYQSLHQAQLNDIWAYVDEEGNEYAIVGTTKGTSIVNVTDPNNPFEVFFEPGIESIWRDMVTHGDYAYITTEAQNGLLIIDLSPLPHSTNLPVAYYNGDNGVEYSSSHTVYAADGYCFLFGSNIGNRGVHILDIATNPMQPTLVSEFDNWYVHDGFVRNDTMYLAHIYDGFFSIVDISDIHNPVLLGTKTTPNNFSHNIWPSDDGKFVFTTDEVNGAFIAAYNIEDPTNIYEVDRVQSSPGKYVVPHNTHYINEFLVTSYYSDGVTIHDATYPHNLIEVGNYDTHPLQQPGFDGCWGVYPFLPSGTILATDREYGLFVLSATYHKAAYLEGTVTDLDTGLPIDGVKISIANWQHENSTNEDGNYATGKPIGGIATVTYEKIGYYPETDNINLQNGIITIHDVQLIPIPPYSITVKVVEAATGTEIPNALLRFETDYISHDGITNGLGEEDMTLYYQDTYTVIAGKWGYVTKCQTISLNPLSPTIVIELEKGYYDDFSFDFGWSTAGSATIGRWERAIPFGTQEMANPDYDAPWDCGKYAFVTGNENNFDFTVDEVNEGDVKLYSPIMDLTTYTNPHVNYYKWFYTRYGLGDVSDSLTIYIRNGIETVQIDGLKKRNTMDEWIHTSIKLSDYITITENMQLYVLTSDFMPEWNVVEAGIDHFWISEGNTSAIDKTEHSNELIIFPNPVESFLTIEHLQTSQAFTVIDLNGKILRNGIVEPTQNTIQLDELTKGIYFLQIGSNTHKFIKN